MFAELLESDLAVGANVASRDAFAWTFLLPTLEPAHVLCFGDLSVTVMDRLTAAGASVQVFARPPTTEQLATITRPADLVLLDGEVHELLHADPMLACQLRDSLAGDACIAIMRAGVVKAGGSNAIGLLTSQPVRALCMGPTGSDPSGASSQPANVLIVPEHQPFNARSRFRRRIANASVLTRTRAARAVGRGPSRASRAHASDLRPMRPGGVDRRVEADAILIGHPTSDLGRPPQWVSDVAESAGVDLDPARWAFAPARGYRSQKPLFLLTERGHHDPTHVLKITQEPRFNQRLMTEAKALRHVRDERLVDRDSVPEVLFAGRHGGLAVVLETAWQGQGFRRHSTATPDCPYAKRAIAWFTTLGQRSAVRGPKVGEVHDEARRLVDRYEQVFHPTSIRRAQLLEYVGRLQGREVPGVFFHGDPGNWNLRARADGAIGVLDWENARPVGPPVWDLALFLKTYGVFVAEAEGRRYTTATFVSQFRPGSPMRSLIDEALRAYAESLVLDDGAVSSLLLLCWVHQALKEASRLAPEAVGSSHSRAVVDRCLDDPRLLSCPARNG